jgi:hypothetical protein
MKAKSAIVLGLAFTVIIITFEAPSFICVRGEGYSNESEEIGNPPVELTPEILITSPKNKTYNSNSIYLSFSVKTGNPGNWSTHVFARELEIDWDNLFFKGDWQQNATHVNYDSHLHEMNVNIGYPIQDVPYGEHSITVYATETVVYWHHIFCASIFAINGSSMVHFSVDTVPPEISFLISGNENFETSNVPLNFSLNESPSSIMYSLDNQPDITILGNTTLTGLPLGPHSLTLYVNDTAGNTAAKTLTFNIVSPTPKPTIPTPPPSTAPEPATQATRLRPKIAYVMAGLVAFLMLATTLVLHRKKREPHKPLGNRAQNQP